jgi:hypothetical protein
VTLIIYEHSATANAKDGKTLPDRAFAFLQASLRPVGW